MAGGEKQIISQEVIKTYYTDCSGYGWAIVTTYIQR